MFDVDNLSARDDHNVAGLQLDFELAAVNGVFQRISRDRPCNCLNASPLLGRIFICHHHAIGVDHSLKFVCEIHGRKLTRNWYALQINISMSTCAPWPFGAVEPGLPQVRIMCWTASQWLPMVRAEAP